MPVFSGRLQDISRDELPRPWDLAFPPIAITANPFMYQICNYTFMKGRDFAQPPFEDAKRTRKSEVAGDCFSRPNLIYYVLMIKDQVFV